MDRSVILGVVYAIIKIVALAALLIYVIWEIHKFGRRRR